MFIFLKPDLYVNTPRGPVFKCEACSLLPHCKCLFNCFIHLPPAKPASARIPVYAICQFLDLPPAALQHISLLPPSCGPMPDDISDSTPGSPHELHRHWVQDSCLVETSKSLKILDSTLDILLDSVLCEQCLGAIGWLNIAIFRK